MKIEVVPIGPSELRILQYIVDLISKRFDSDAMIGTRTPIEKFKKNENRDQYSSARMMEALIDMKISKKGALLGVANADLYTHSLNFVFGQADRVNRVAVISISRLKPNFYGLQDNDDLVLKRVGKEAVHELGHVFGLDHCNQPKCVMFFSNSLQDTDMKEDEFCNKCKRALDYNLKTWRV
ncbi:MAG: archaemetzincin family Zn-dependent metalloprotease [Candidatus Bathyarchaeota archaeon]|nr:archaemetzincin family Zn-dependent metalloprotease [Candidatus Bathyarchaeota archaeon]